MTIDLNATLIRAEALFGRFQRTVEAVDRKESFPAPRAKTITDKAVSSVAKAAAQRLDVQGRAASSSSNTADDISSGKGKDQDNRVAAESKTTVISPELRQLLSRTFVVLPKTAGEGGSLRGPNTT